MTEKDRRELTEKNKLKAKPKIRQHPLITKIGGPLLSQSKVSIIADQSKKTFFTDCI